MTWRSVSPRRLPGWKTMLQDAGNSWQMSHMSCVARSLQCAQWQGHWQRDWRRILNEVLVQPRRLYEHRSDCCDSVTDLMELAKLDLKEFPLRLVEVDLRNLILSAVQLHVEDAGRLGMTLRGIEPIPSVTTVIDPDRINQVLDNILGNAISYAGEGASIGVSLEGCGTPSG